MKSESSSNSTAAESFDRGVSTMTKKTRKLLSKAYIHLNNAVCDMAEGLLDSAQSDMLEARAVIGQLLGAKKGEKVRLEEQP